MNNLRTLCLALAGLWFSGSSALHAQTINWGSEILDDFADSHGSDLTSGFVFELGIFKSDFMPDANNTVDWFANWQVFDAAAYSVENEYFASTVRMTSATTSDSPALTPGASSFEGATAYLWIRNSNLAQAGSEWLLARATNWVFPAFDPDCCDNGELPIEWSSSDLTPSYTPIWGSHATNEGGGVITTSGDFTYQTATFIPEPSLVSLFAATMLLLMMRRRRQP